MFSIRDLLLRSFTETSSGGGTPPEDAPSDNTPISDDTQEDTLDTSEEEDSPDEESLDGVFDQKRALRRIRKINQENKNLRARAKQSESKTETVETERDALMAENLRLKVALEHGIPPAIANRLTGATVDELLEDAQELMELFETKKPPSRQPKEQGKPLGASPKDTPEELDLDKRAARMFRR